MLTMLLLQDQKALWKLLNYTGLNITVRTGSILLHRFIGSVKVRLKDSCTIPKSVHVNDISVDELYGLDYEDVKGVC